MAIVSTVRASADSQTLEGMRQRFHEDKCASRKAGNDMEALVCCFQDAEAYSEVLRPQGPHKTMHHGAYLPLQREQTRQKSELSSQVKKQSRS
jgi:hypothetical protein